MKTTRWSLTHAAAGLAFALLLGAAPVAQAATETNSTAVSVAVSAQANVATLNDGVDTYVLTVTDRGGGIIKGLELDVPIAASYQLSSASFDQDDAWVSARGDGHATIRIEGMRGVGDSVTGTLTFAGPAASQANALGERLTATWITEEGDFATERTALSNLPGVGVRPLAVASAGQGYNLSSNIFAPGEPVSFWYTTAAGASTQLVVVDGVLGLQPGESDIEETDFSTYMLTDATGGLSLPMSAAGIAPGSYTLVAYGNWSGATAAASIRIP